MKDQWQITRAKRHRMRQSVCVCVSVTRVPVINQPALCCWVLVLVSFSWSVMMASDTMLFHWWIDLHNRKSTQAGNMKYTAVKAPCMCVNFTVKTLDTTFTINCCNSFVVSSFLCNFYFISRASSVLLFFSFSVFFLLLLYVCPGSCVSHSLTFPRRQRQVTFVL